MLLLPLLLPLLFLCLLQGDLAQAGDRYDLGQVIATVPPDGPPEAYGNMVIGSSKKGNNRQPPAVFPHWAHRARYTCRVCHMELGISLRAGETGINRAKILGGKYCGACHNGKEAFAVRDEEKKTCELCHVKNSSTSRARFQALAQTLPAAEFGNKIDWAKALNEGIIQPGNSTVNPNMVPMSLPGKLRQPLPLGTDMARSDVGFSHTDHMAEMDCSNCHPDIFAIKRNGTESFTMENNLYGWYCGSCHRRVTFPMTDCHRCHPQMKGGSH